MKIEIHKVSKQLKNLREQKQLTQEELAKHLGISRQSIISLERGKCLPSLPLAIAFSEIFETPFESIFYLEDSINNHFQEEVKNMLSHQEPASNFHEESPASDISPWSPSREAKDLHEAIDRLFEMPAEMGSPMNNLQMPTINIYEKDGNVIVLADVPGIKEEDLSIEVGEDTLGISGERKTESEVREEEYYRKEVSSGTFTRTVQLPAIVDKEKAEAELRNGQLVVTLPKKAEVAPKITKIKVKKVQ